MQYDRQSIAQSLVEGALRAAADDRMREAIKHIEWKLFDV